MSEPLTDEYLQKARMTVGVGNWPYSADAVVKELLDEIDRLKGELEEQKFYLPEEVGDE